MNTNTNSSKKSPQIVTPIFRASFAQVFEARKADEKDPNSKAKFSIVMLYKDKSKPQFANDPEAVDLTPLKQLVRDAVIAQLAPIRRSGLSTPRPALPCSACPSATAPRRLTTATAPA